MGDTKKPRKKYQRPLTPWQNDRIEEERDLKREYGLKNKKELWKMRGFLQRFKHHAKRLSSVETKQKESEKTAMMKKLQRYGLLKEGGEIDDILGISLKDVLNRRIQNVILKKGLARTAKQARQFIVHRHITVKGKKITSPSYIMSLDEEAAIGFYGNSALSNNDHPERAIPEKKIKTQKKGVKERGKEESPKTGSKRGETKERKLQYKKTAQKDSGSIEAKKRSKEGKAEKAAKPAESDKK